MPYTVKPLPSKSYKFKQSEYDDVPVLSTRSLILAPSGSGKSVLLQRLITDVYDGCFEAGIHIFSHSINIDDTWLPVKRYLEQQGFPPEKYCHEAFSEQKLTDLMAEQKAGEASTSKQ